MNSLGSTPLPGDDAGRTTSDIVRHLAEVASEALRDQGRIVLGGTAYQVIIPDGARAGDPVYLQGPDRSVLAVRVHVTARPAAPGELEL